MAEPPLGVAKIDPPLAIPVARIVARLEALQAAIIRDQIPCDLALVFAMRSLSNHIVRTGAESNFRLDREQEATIPTELMPTNGKVH